MKANETTLTHLLHAGESGIKVSIYQPTHPASSAQAVQEDSIRFKNALQIIRGHEAYDDDRLAGTMSSLEALLDDVEFWKHRTVGLAVFADENGYETVSLPYDVTEAQYIGKQFCVHPLALALSLSSNYYILDVNHTHPRLLEGSPSGCSELEVGSMPKSFESITENIEYTRELQHQSGGVGTFHGHTDEKALQSAALRFYREIARAVDSYLSGRNEPLVMVGVENRVAEVRQLLTYPNQLERYVAGSGEAMNEQALHEAVIPIVEEYGEEQRAEAVNLFRETPPERTLVGVEDIMRASKEGRVDRLYLPRIRHTADTVREGYDKTIVIQLDDHSDEVEAIELLVRSVLAMGGEVQAVEVGTFVDERPRALSRF